MLGSELIHHFTSIVVESGVKGGVIAKPQPRRHGGKAGLWTGGDFVRLLREVGLALNDTFYGLASSPCPAACGAFGVELLVVSDTLGEALDRYGRFYGIVTDGLKIELSVHGTMAQIELSVTDPALDPSHFLIEWYATRLYGFTQWLIGYEIPQIEVEFAHARQLPMSAYVDVLGKRIAFDRAANRVIMPRHYLDRRVIRDRDDLATVATSEFDPERRSYTRDTWGKRIKVLLRSNLYAMATLPTMEELARQFAVSSQTLRRGLRTEGTSYREIKAEARRDIVETTISDTSLTLSQISVLAGFAETNGLVRAMKSWTGLSPSAVRRAAIESVGNATAAPTCAGREE